MLINKTEFGFLVSAGKYYLHIIHYGDNVVRFAYSDSEDLPVSTAAVDARPLKTECEFEDGYFRLGQLRLAVDEESLTVRIYDQDLFLLSEDLEIEPDLPRLKKKLLWEKGFYGNGEKYCWLNHLGMATANYNSDVLFHNPIQHAQVSEMHTAIPFYLGIAPGRAYGLYFDNTFRTEFDFAKTDPESVSLRAEGGKLDYYFIAGASAADVVIAYGMLTGKMPMPPKKYLAYQQSRYSYENQAEILAVAENLKRYAIPCDILYLDIHYMDGYKVFTTSSERFPAFRETITLLNDMGYAVVVIINPGVKAEAGYRVYEEGLKKGYYVTAANGEIFVGEVWPKPAVFPDFLRSEVRKWWGEFHRELLACGVDGIWNDMNEPANFTLPGGTLPADAVHHDDSGRALSHAEAHNLYGFFHTRATREALEGLAPEKRHFVLTRAAFAGSQRYAALWTGDNSSIWEHLEISIPMILNLGLSGFSFVGADVGGYRGDCGGELLIRWTQLGAFLPFFRNHSEIGTAHQEPWAYPDHILSIVRDYICLRYRFLTYYYNLMRKSATTGEPTVRPLFYHYQHDMQTYNISDQFLLGSGVLVCPVVRPGVNCRQVYLPEGLWYDYWTGEKHSGGVHVMASAPLERLPLFIKAGTILPVDEIGGRLTLHCYPGEESCCRLYFDDGYSNDYKKGCFSEIEVTMSADPQQPEVNISVISNNYPLPEIDYLIITESGPGARPAFKKSPGK
jgi:alpha-glucosidase